MSTPPVPAGDASDAESLAVELARAYRGMVAFYRDQLQLSGPEADARARGADCSDEEAAADLARTRERPPDEVSWYDLNRLAERDPDAVATQWQRIKQAARNELASGHRTAQALEWQGQPWDRARFLALRTSFREGTPASGIEAALVDSAAEAFSTYLEATEHHHRMLSVDMEHEEKRAEELGEWRPMRLGYADAIHQAAREAELAHARFLRTVKMLHEVRKFAPSVYVGHAGQVNVGSQQVNMSAEATDEPARTRHPGKAVR